MSKSIIVPEDLYNKAVETAARDHVSVEEFVSVAVANRLASREYIESRAKLFSRDETWNPRSTTACKAIFAWFRI
jgi:hypothetical protein